MTTNPTADAAKLLPHKDDRRAKWTLASGDEIFLVGENGVGLSVAGHVIVKPLREWHALANTRPQPAPPAGEPDWERIIEPAFFVLGIKLLTRDEFRAELIALARHAYGLAARPKVGDAEVLDVVKECRANAADPRGNPYWPSHVFVKAADLLDRLAGELVEVRTKYSETTNYYEGLIDAAETKLSEREAELAQLRQTDRISSPDGGDE